jgi:hypothetical protein
MSTAWRMLQASQSKRRDMPFDSPKLACHGGCAKRMQHALGVALFGVEFKTR